MAPDVMKRLKPLLDAGMDLAHMTPAKAEAIVRDLVKQGEVRRHEAAAVAQVLVDRGREAAAKLTELVSIEVAKQLDLVIGQVEALEARVAEMSARMKSRATGSSAPAAPAPAPASAAASAVSPATKPVAKKPAAAKKVPAKKATATKAPAQKAAPAKKGAAAKKAAAVKKAPAKTAPTTARN